MLSRPKYGRSRDSGTPRAGCYHRRMLDLPPVAEPLLRIALIALAALIAFVGLRVAVTVGVRHVVEHRSAAAGGLLPPEEVRGRVRTVGNLIVRIGGAGDVRMPPVPWCGGPGAENVP